MRAYFLLSFALVFVLPRTLATLSKSDKKMKKTSSTGSEKKTKTTTSTSQSLSPSSILEEEQSAQIDPGPKTFPGSILGYVTPWNNKGYDVAQDFGGKLSHVSPVWLQLNPKGGPGGDFSIGGLHDVDAGWMGRLKGKVVPRVLFDGWTGQDYMDLFRSEEERSEVATLIADTVEQRGFDGIVLELWSQLGGQAKKETRGVIKKIAKQLHLKNRVVGLAIPPALYHGDQKGMFDKSDFDDLVDDIDMFSLMTYDYSNFARPGANAPLHWMKRCVEAIDPEARNRGKILLGLNFYGLRYTANGGDHVLGRDWMALLKETTEHLNWDEKDKEHYLVTKVDGKKTTLFYPTKESIALRVNLAKEMGTGISIWEIGQGLDHFYQQL